MSTPGNVQESSTKTYGQAIQALEDAREEMNRIQDQVRTAKADLQARYGGEDGRAYAQVMDTWLAEVDRIKKTCEAMENQLGNSLQASNNVQSANFQAVADQGKLTPFGSSVENGAYTAMTGG